MIIQVDFENSLFCIHKNLKNKEFLQIVSLLHILKRHVLMKQVTTLCAAW
jgi:hypothetical protein